VKGKVNHPEKEGIMNTRAKVRVTGNRPIVDHTHRVLRGNAVAVTKLALEAHAKNA